MLAVKHFFASVDEVMLRNDMAAFTLSLHKARTLIGLTAPPMARHQPFSGSSIATRQRFKAARQLTAARDIHGRVEATLIAQNTARSARKAQPRTELRA